MHYVSLIFRWLLVSSKDPRQISLTVKAALLGIIPLVMDVTGMVCRVGQYCINVDPSLLEQIGNGIAELTFLFFSAVSLIGMVYGLVRKAVRTLNGENLAIKE